MDSNRPISGPRPPDRSRSLSKPPPGFGERARGILAAHPKLAALFRSPTPPQITTEEISALWNAPPAGLDALLKRLQVTFPWEENLELVGTLTQSASDAPTEFALTQLTAPLTPGEQTYLATLMAARPASPERAAPGFDRIVRKADLRELIETLAVSDRRFLIDALGRVSWWTRSQNERVPSLAAHVLSAEPGKGPQTVFTLFDQPIDHPDRVDANCSALLVRPYLDLAIRHPDLDEFKFFWAFPLEARDRFVKLSQEQARRSDVPPVNEATGHEIMLEGLAAALGHLLLQSVHRDADAGQMRAAKLMRTWKTTFRSSPVTGMAEFRFMSKQALWRHKGGQDPSSWYSLAEHDTFGDKLATSLFPEGMFVRCGYTVSPSEHEFIKEILAYLEEKHTQVGGLWKIWENG